MALPEPIPPLDPKRSKAFLRSLDRFTLSEAQLAPFREELARRHD